MKVKSNMLGQVTRLFSLAYDIYNKYKVYLWLGLEEKKGEEHFFRRKKGAKSFFQANLSQNLAYVPG